MEGFFEFFVTVIVAIIFYEMGLVKRISALRTIYLDAILYFGGGLIGTGHHWYWTGQTELNLAVSEVSSLRWKSYRSRSSRLTRGIS